MRLTFQLRYHTEYGQSLLLSGTHELLGNGDPQRAVPLQYLNNEFWQVRLTFPDGQASRSAINYHYILRNADGSLVEDWGLGRTIAPAVFKNAEVLLIDAWNFAGFYENAFYTEPFQQVLLKANHTEFQAPVPARVTHTFKIKAPLLPKGQTLCLVGNTPALGNWNAAGAVPLTRADGDVSLCVQLDLSQAVFPLAYKYGVYDLAKRAFVRYEERPDRALHDVPAPNKLTVVNDGFAALPANTWRAAGVAIPVFSLRSEQSFGVGEFADLKPLADWCKRTGLKLIQLLPINDTTATHTWMDSYPYSAISAFALHPMFLNLARVAAGPNRALLQEIESERKRLNALEAVDYEAVMKAKLAFIRRVYPSQKEETFASSGFLRFFERNKAWLEPYAAFCHLRDQYGTADFNQWPAYRDCKPSDIAALTAPDSATYDEIALHYFIQYHLHLQLREATEYTHANGVILKGDLAIGVYRHSADVWQQPTLFHTDVQAGAPPDAFAAKGQNWGFPTYNWPRMKEGGFAWWKRRFTQMGDYFDAFRIDHVLGFFRIWSIPMDAVEGIMGHFVPAIPVDISEFASRGIAFDRKRYVTPYITDEVLWASFGPEHARVRNDFLNLDGQGGFTSKPEFATQRKVEQHFAALEDNALNNRLKLGLYDLISNVLLFEVEGAGGRQLHFRLGMDSTPSFKKLDGPTQAQLKDLYIDYFYRRQDVFWAKEAMQKLPALKRVTNMLVCGEDLGMVPACVPEVMKQLGLLSLEIQRMPKAMNQQFSRPKDAPYLSVVTPSTHDMSTIRGWWLEDPGLTQKFFNQELGQPGKAPQQCEPWLNKAVVFQHLASPAMWSIFQLQDLLGMDQHLRREKPEDERINVPANPRHYWRYRMHMSLETLLRADAFNDQLKSYVQQSGR